MTATRRVDSPQSIINKLDDSPMVFGDTHVGMLAEMPKDTEQYTAMQLSEFAQLALDSIKHVCPN